MIRAIFLLAFFILPVTLSAQGEGGLAGAFLRMGLGARAIAMGGAQTAVADDGFASYYNPAGLPFLEKRHFSSSYSLLSLDRKIQYISYSQRLGPQAGLSVFWLGAGVDNIDGRDFAGNHISDLGESVNIFGLSFANRFHDKISIGLTVKIINHNLDLDYKNVSADDLFFDIGLMVIPLENLKVGIQLKDIDGTLRWDTQNIFSRGTTSVDSIPYIINTGASYLLKDKYLISTTLEFNQKLQEKFRLGLEYQINDLYALRIGTEDDRIAFGGGLLYSVPNSIETEINYAFLQEISGEGGTHLFSWEFIF